MMSGPSSGAVSIQAQRIEGFLQESILNVTIQKLGIMIIITNSLLSRFRILYFNGSRDFANDAHPDSTKRIPHRHGE